MKNRCIRFESLEDRCLLAVTAGGAEFNAVFAETAPQVTSADQMEFALVITDAIPVEAEIADPTVSVGDGVNLISETQFGETVYVSLYVKSLDPNYGIQYGYCSLHYDETGVTSGVYYDSPNFDTATINEGFDFSSVGCISAFGGEPSNSSASFGKTGWALVGTMSFSADVVGQYEFTTGVAVNAKGEERESWGFVREDFDDTYEYGTPAVSASLAITGEMPMIEDVTVEGWTGGYDGYAHSITVNDPSAETDKILYSTDGVNYNLDVCPEYFDEGTYTTYVRVTRTGFSNWYGSATVEIQHVAPVVTTLEDVVDSEDGVMSLREAIGRAIEGDVITFDPSLAGGTITLAGTRLNVSVGIAIDASIIGGVTINADGRSRVFFTNGGSEENPIEFIGLTIMDGFTKGGGAGIFMDGGVLKLTDCTIIGNTASYSNGGGIYNEGGSLLVTGSEITDNDSENDGYGGGIYTNGGSVTIINSEISENISSGHGGGIYNSRGTLTVTNTSFSKNHTRSYYGGGVFNESGILVMANTIFSSNFASSLGGGIFNNGSVSISSSIFTDNYSNGYWGGGICNESGSLTAIDTIFSRNWATRSGGGIHNEGNLILINCSLLENTVDLYGGGIWNGGTVTIVCSTISDNSAQSGGGIYNGGGKVILINSIVARNSSATERPDVSIINGSLNAYNTLSSFTDWTESKNCLVYDPTQPLFEDAENGDYTLAKYSQALNMGDNSYVETETDLAGNQRIVNGVVDLGAYERQELGATLMLTGTRGNYVSYGANRHKLEWVPVADAVMYELAYSTDGLNWTRIKTEETSAVVTNLTYGDEVSYRVRALGEGAFIDSDWSDVKTFAVCPMDINNDRAIAGADRRLMASAWLSEEGDEDYQYYADINGDGDVSNSDRSFLTFNWLKDVGEDELSYPRPLAADAVFAEYESVDIEIDLTVF